MPTTYTTNYVYLLTYSVANQSGYVALALAMSPTSATFFYPARSPDTGEPIIAAFSALQPNSQVFAMQRCTRRPTDLREMQQAVDEVNAIAGDKRRWSQWDWCVALLRAMPRDMIDFGALAAFALNTGLELQG